MTTLAVRAKPRIDSPVLAATPMLRSNTDTYYPMKKAGEPVTSTVHMDILLTTRTPIIASRAMSLVLPVK